MKERRKEKNSILVVNYIPDIKSFVTHNLEGRAEIKQEIRELITSCFTFIIGYSTVRNKRRMRKSK